MPDEEGSHAKVGGLNKNWWYVIGAGVAIVGYLYYRNYKNNQAAAALNSATGSALGSTGSAGNSTTDFGSSTGTTSTISTLSDWMNSVQSWAVKTLGSDPALVQNALQNYSNGNCLTQQEYNIIDKALGALGAPPDAPYQGVILCPNSSGSTGSSGGGTTTSGGGSTSSGTGAAPSTSNNPLFASLGALSQAANGWFHIPNPQIGSLLSSIGVQFETIGNAQYFNPADIALIANPAEGSALTRAGYKAITIGNHQYYNPNQKVPAKR